MIFRTFAAVLVVVCFSNCDSDSDGEALPHEAFARELRLQAEHFAYHEGDWLEDWGDGAFFGPAYHARVGVTTGDAELLAIADEAALRNLGVLEESENLLEADVNELSMSTLGLIEYQDATGGLDAEGLTTLSTTVTNMDDILALLGYYLEPGLIDSWAVETYGPTAINTMVVLMNLQYAYYLGERDDELRQRYVEFARQAVAAIDERAWNGETYDIGDEREELFLYPNVTMLITNVRLYQLTEEEAYLERALTVYDGIQALRLDDGEGYTRYRSPYSIEAMGATTDNYSTLSSQNYTMLALLLLYEVTGDEAYLDELDGIVHFIEDRMVDEYCRSEITYGSVCDPDCGSGQVCLSGRCVDELCQESVLHHWIDGRLATADDPDLFCSGCNLQLLYLLWYRQEVAS